MTTDMFRTRGERVGVACVCRALVLFLGVCGVLSGISLDVGGEGRRGGVLFAQGSFASDQLEVMYCGQFNCYELIGVERQVTLQELKKAYRAASRKYHPDKIRDIDRQEAERRFQKINKAYEVLSNAEVRGAYDYYLDHPDDLYALYYGIRAVYPQKTNPFTVLILLLAFISLGQWMNSRYQYNYIFNGVRQSPVFQRAVQFEVTEKFGTKFKKLTAEEQASERKTIEDRILAERVQLNDGEPIDEPVPWHQTYMMRFLILPYTGTVWCLHWAIWIWKFYILGDDYGEAEQTYLTMKAIALTDYKWSKLSEEEKTALLSKQLWIKTNREVYGKEQEELERERRVNSTRYRQWKRWKKRNPDTTYMMEE
eukprot:GHVQ01011574.1.p1 GENE.GHVQ01011574.1~~GHVQ01011574.1.p1  ORF type:complete len:368 (-),score=63.00 GHVQ01011574.1:519-1622(-)